MMSSNCRKHSLREIFLCGRNITWYANIVNYLVSNMFPPGLSWDKKEKVKSEEKYYVWDDPHLWKHCTDQVLRRCIPENEAISILTFCHFHTCGGHFGSKRTAKKVLECDFYWPSLFRMHILSIRHANIVKRLVIYPNEMKCHNHLD